MFWYFLLLVAGFLSVLPSCVATNFYVIPANPSNQTCPSQLCHTLDQCVQNISNSSFQGQRNISLLFLAGTHSLNYDMNIYGVDELVISKLEQEATGDNTVVIDMQANISVSSVSVLEMYDVKVTTTNALKLSMIVFNATDVKNLTLYKVEMNKVILKAISTKTMYPLQHINIINCNWYTESQGILLEFFNNGLNNSSNLRLVSLQIHSTNISINSTISGTSPVYIFCYDLQPFQPLLTVDIKNSSFEGSSYDGFSNFCFLRSLTIRDTYFRNAKGPAVFIIGVFIGTSIIIQSTTVAKSNLGIIILAGVPTHIILFHNCTFVQNDGPGITLTNIDKVIVNNSKFIDNRGTPIVAYESHLELSGETTFENNIATRGGGLSMIYSEVYFANNSNITFRNNSVNGFGGAIYVVSKIYTVQTAFADLPLTHDLSDSYTSLLLNQIPCLFQFNVNNIQSQVNFINNKATLGGNAIYGAPVNAMCKNINAYGTPSKILNFKEEAVESSNLSLIASDPTRVCFCDRNNRPDCENTSIVKQKAQYPGEKFNISLVLVGYNFGTVTGSIYANTLRSGSYEQLGQNQHIQLANADSCTALVYSIHSEAPYEHIKLTPDEQVSNEDEIERNKEASKNCAYFPDIKQCTSHLTTPIYINVTLEECPLGFILNKTHLTCECDEHLSTMDTRENITCEIQNNTGYIYRQGTVWVGVNQEEDDNTNSTYYLSYNLCPNDYCKNERTAVNLFDPDTQCNKNHAGNLCGRCKANYSLFLGSDRCDECQDNNGLALLIFFAAAGFILVLFIKILDLTVAHGTVNGLIFYANIVWSYNSILFPAQNNFNGTTENNVTLNYYNVLRVFIAWINLDFGIETCFFQGNDASIKTGLQFVFPFYIWVIAVSIIILCRYSLRATKLFGHNIISVLATLLLLSYSKLLRTITNIFTYAELACSNSNDTRLVWAIDGTINYEHPHHIGLIVVGLMFFLVFCIPYTLSLLLVPYLKRWDHLKPLRWINKLKPFYDSYYGPLKDKFYCQYWIGVLLIVRVIGQVVFTSTSTNNPFANILFLVVVTIVLLAYSATLGNQYKKWYVSLFENLYILNLGILAGALLFIQKKNEPNTNNEEHAAIMVSATVALLQFVCIFTLHLVNLRKGTVCKHLRKLYRNKRKEIVNEQPNEPQHQANERIFNVDLSYSNELRESLLDYVYVDGQ